MIKPIHTAFTTLKKATRMSDAIPPMTNPTDSLKLAANALIDTLIIVAPSGAGKSSAIFKLLERHGDVVALACSHTTRAPRKGERHGIHYHFVSQDEFIRLRESGEFLEWAQVHDHYYGTSISEIQKLKAPGKKVIIEVDIQGLINIKHHSPQIPALFILPPSFAEMTRRLTKRGTDSPESLKIRYHSAHREIAQSHLCDYYMINDDLEESICTLTAWILEGTPPPLDPNAAEKLSRDLIDQIHKHLSP